MTSHTRETAHTYLLDLFGDDAWAYDIDTIREELHQQCGHWNIALLNDPSVETPGIDFWHIVARNTLDQQPCNALGTYLQSIADMQARGDDGSNPRDRGE